MYDDWRTKLRRYLMIWLAMFLLLIVISVVKNWDIFALSIKNVFASLIKYGLIIFIVVVGLRMMLRSLW